MRESGLAGKLDPLGERSGIGFTTIQWWLDMKCLRKLQIAACL
jgi:hypothetical protein